VTAKYQNRTATSIQIKLVWTQSIKSAYYGQNQWFNATIGGVSTGDVKIASYNTWYNGSEYYYNDTVTVETGWISVPAEATKTSVSIKANYWTSPSNWVNSSWSYTMPIPTY
ncbi:MAG: hypothetical protein II689_00115, partial [Firmicutes bacterium]|nr:hypothetical protein [Bacillota bacterium]